MFYESLQNQLNFQEICYSIYSVKVKLKDPVHHLIALKIFFNKGKLRKLGEKLFKFNFSVDVFPSLLRSFEKLRAF